MKFAILGAGALGTILGAHLARAGHPVTMIARGERARFLQRQGLILTGLVDLKARTDVVDDPKRLTTTDTLIVATKAIDSAASLAALKHLVLQNALSVQNGVLKNELLAQTFGGDRVLGAMADFSGELLEDGSVKFTRNVCLHIGETQGGMSARATEIAGIIDAAGVKTQAVADVRIREWSKFVGWLPQFCMAVLTRQLTWKYLVDERSVKVLMSIARETAALAEAMRIPVVDSAPLPVPTLSRATEAEAARIIREQGEKVREYSPEHRMSAQQDVLRGSRIELEETVGFAIRRAAELGVPMPTLETCYRLMAVAYA